MSKQHLTSFKVENFKRFDSLELTDIGQFNLIVGDNNVGKTSVLEALLFNYDRRKCLVRLHKTLFLKGLDVRPKMVYGSKGEVLEVQYPEENFLKYLAKDVSKDILFKSEKNQGDWTTGVSIEMGNPRAIGRDDNRNPFETFINASPDNRYLTFVSWFYDSEDPEVSEPTEIEVSGIYEHLLQATNGDFPFISTSLPRKGMLPKAYLDLIGISRKEKRQLIEAMKFLLPEIEDFEVRKISGEEHLLVGMQDKDELMPISIFGESVTRATQILLEISKHKGQRLMIDEIDTGIHYSRMKQFLKTIFQIAEKNEVQLFMTTHSLECQQAFAEVFEEPDMVQHQAKARQFTLIEKPDGRVVASKRNFEQLQNSLETGYDTRGGKRGW